MGQNKEMVYRNDGMAFALRIAKEKGVDALEKEVKFRNASMLPSGVTEKALMECLNNSKAQILDTVLIMSLNVLRDQFGFGSKRLSDFKERFNRYSECLADDYVDWETLQQIIKDECGIDTQLRVNDKNIPLREGR